MSICTRSRIGDLTIGDYWGIEQYSPEMLKKWRKFEESMGFLVY